jgi:hypothetical protein
VAFHVDCDITVMDDDAIARGSQICLEKEIPCSSYGRRTRRNLGVGRGGRSHYPKAETHQRSKGQPTQNRFRNHHFPPPLYGWQSHDRRIFNLIAAVATTTIGV